MKEIETGFSAEFLSHNGKRSFTVFMHPAESTTVVRGAILFIHPFAEEMHKSRRTVAQQARRLVSVGYSVMLLDLDGCGDSSGSFSNASWDGWLEDADYAVSYLRNRVEGPVCVWGLRLGALLACHLTQERADIDTLLMWQPTLNGEQEIDQFLRVELAGLALQGAQGFDRSAYWNELRSGRSLEVAGYELSSGLALGISHVRLGDLRPASRVVWLDLGGPLRDAPALASQNVIDHWQEAGVRVDWKSIGGEPFWRNAGDSDNPELLSSTLELLDRI